MINHWVNSHLVCLQVRCLYLKSTMGKVYRVF